MNAAPGLANTVDAVVSLCRVHDRHLPPGAVEATNQIQIWLIDAPGLDANAHLHFVLDQAARAVEQLRGEGRRVFVHCAAGQSRTPAVAALLAARTGSISAAQALCDVIAALPDAQVKPFLAQALSELAGVPQGTDP